MLRNVKGNICNDYDSIVIRIMIHLFLRYEANLRIKFHVETETKKLNEKWMSKMKQLKMDHDDEKRCLMKIAEDARKIMVEFITKKCQMDCEKMVDKAVIETRTEIEQKCAESIETELAQQTFMFQEYMEITLKNMEINDMDRMNELRNQCLRAMDLQNHLLICRQITELMHVVAIKKSNCRFKMMDMSNEYESIIGTILHKLGLDDDIKTMTSVINQILCKICGWNF